MKKSALTPYVLLGFVLGAYLMEKVTQEPCPPPSSVTRQGFWRNAQHHPARGGRVQVQYAQDTCTACPNRRDRNEKFSWWLSAHPGNGLSSGWRYGSGTVRDTIFAFRPSTAPDPLRPVFKGTAEQAVALTLQEGGAE